MAKKTLTSTRELRKETREWLQTHTLQDVRSIAKDLENAGEDVSELVDAIDDLEAAINADPLKASHRGAAKAEA